ncbi:MAG TPA: SDR family NAD(P)-dependent oxidoreductase [Streptosporangiaceae bacterium]|nr:SDR family NAD(P)-dependent oxidoreductase [Streptosporangiaceae bacterium]
MRLGQGTSAIVTGACSGLGLATARALAATGTAVALLDLPDAKGDDLAAELGNGAIYAPGDVTSGANVARAIELARDRGHLRVAVNCAGIAGPNPILGPAAASLTRFTTLMQVNVAGTVNVMGQAATAMAAYPDDGTEDRGVIVNTSSVAAFDGQRGETAYSASKGAVAAMTLPAARELASVRIRVVAIAPGRFRTPLIEKFREGELDVAAADVPHPHRLGEPGEFASLVMHVIANPMINGAVIRIDGALRMSW